MKLFLLLLQTIASTSFAAGTYTITAEINPEEEFIKNPILLRNQSILFSRQNKDDWMLINSDGTKKIINTGTGSTSAHCELTNGEVAYASKDGVFHFMDNEGNLLREFQAFKQPRAIWSMLERQDGMLVALTNRMDGRSVYGSVHFIEPQNQSHVEINLGKNGVYSSPVLLPNQSVALKTQSYSVFIISPNGTPLQMKSMGKNGSEILSSFSDGTLLTGGRFGNERKAMFLDPLSGSVKSELVWSTNTLDQDLGFANVLPGGRFVTGLVEYVPEPNGFTHYHERLEFYDQNRQLLNTYRIDDVGFSIEWRVQALPDGRLVHGAGRKLYLFSSEGQYLEHVELPYFIEKAPLIADDGGVYVTTSFHNTNGDRESRIYLITPNS